jgi:signal peptidase I
MVRRSATPGTGRKRQANLQNSDRQERPARSSWIAEWVVTIIIFLFGTTTLLQPFVVPTPSMENTVLAGDHLLVDKLAYSPAGAVSKHLLPYAPVKRGDIIVFRFPPDIQQTYVKRVIGVPGDRIRIVNKQVYLSGKKLEEPYKVHRASYIDSYRDNFPGIPNTRLFPAALEMLERHVVGGELVVPADRYFALGDNRDNSGDSRYWGFVPRENIIGKPLIIYWSYDAPAERLANPNIDLDHLRDLSLNFFAKTRWRRTFKLVRGYPLN